MQDLKKKWLEILFVKEFLSYAKDPSAQGVERFTHLIARMRQTGSDKLYGEILDHLKTDPKAKRLIEERYLPKPLPTSELLLLPEGSLGYLFGKHLTDNNLKQEIYAQFEIKSDIEYVSFRGGQLHDVLHVVTGFGIDHMGEFAIQAFTFAQIKSPLVAVFLAGDLLYSSRRGPNFAFNAFKAMAEGFLLGCRLPNFYGVKWEEMFGRNLEEVRSELGIRNSALAFNKV
jgi:ubiquinone biosynthesis protein COQ4